MHYVKVFKNRTDCAPNFFVCTSTRPKTIKHPVCLHSKEAGSNLCYELMQLIYLRYPSAHILPSLGRDSLICPTCVTCSANSKRMSSIHDVNRQ